MTKAIYIHNCEDCPYFPDATTKKWLCMERDCRGEIPKKCQLQDAPKREDEKPEVVEERKINKTCNTYSPCYCNYKSIANLECSFTGLCEYQRPKEVR